MDFVFGSAAADRAIGLTWLALTVGLCLGVLLCRYAFQRITAKRRG